MFPPAKLSLTYEIHDVRRRVVKKKEVLDAARPIPVYVLDRLRDDFAVEWTYNSNSIEGNTLSLAETKMVLEDGITIGGKSLSGMVRIVGANFVPPNARKVPDMIGELLAYVNANPDGYDLVTLATLFHHRFVWIHPFNDGNGRTVRLAFNLLLMRAGYPPAVILSTDRKKYIAALNAANKGSYDKLLLLMYQAVERSLNIYISSIGGDYEDYEPTGVIAEDKSAVKSYMEHKLK